MISKEYPKVKIIYLRHINRIEDYKLIQELHETQGWSVKYMCEELGIARSSYYKWLNKKENDRDIENQRILEIIKEIAISNNSLFGYYKMTYALNRKLGTSYNHKRIYRLMATNDIQSSFRKKSSYHYKRSDPEETAENLLDRDFNADRPNEKWTTDVTEKKIPGTSEKLYITTILDLYDFYPVAMSVSTRNDTLLTDDVLDKAHDAYPDATPLFHSDRGFQYTRAVYKTKLESFGMTQSMSRVSRCIDNGPCECFQGIFKEIMSILYPDVNSKEEMIKAIYGTLDYYINEYPQKRFKGKTAGEVRKEALKAEIPIVYPVAKNPKIVKFWSQIEKLKAKHSHTDDDT